MGEIRFSFLYDPFLVSGCNTDVQKAFHELYTSIIRVMRTANLITITEA